MFRYLSAYLIPLTAGVGLMEGGWLSYLTVCLVYLFIPIADQLLGADSSNLDDSTRQYRQRHWFTSVLLYAAVPVQWGLVWSFLTVWQGDGTLIERAGWIVSVGLACGGLGITVAHELVHRRVQPAYWAGKSLLLTVFYMHFAIEHLRGHHERVATDEDPASARFGESVYRFIPRSIFQQFGSAWRLEVGRLARQGHRILSIRNEMIWISILQTGWAVTVAVLFGGIALMAYLVVALVAVTLLEVVNYVEHYGLRRHQRANGLWEPVRSQHSWNSDYRLSRAFLFELPRHTDHHMNGGRPFSGLMSVASAPQLPAGYPSMVLLALLPPLWFRVMNPRVASLNFTRDARSEQRPAQ